MKMDGVSVGSMDAVILVMDVMTIPPLPNTAGASPPTTFLFATPLPLHASRTIPLFFPLFSTPSAGSPPASVFLAHAGR